MTTIDDAARGSSPHETPTTCDLSVEQMVRPIGLWTDQPRFSWAIDAASERDVRQIAYELEVDSGGLEVARTGRVASSASVLVEVPGLRLDSDTVYEWRVRVWTNRSEEPTPWGTSSFETTLLDPSAWTAPWIEPQQESVRADGASTFQELFTLRIDTPPEDRLLPAPYIRQRFELPARPVRARLFATAQGIYHAEINGTAASDEMLGPGADSYDKHMSFHVHDVTELCHPGVNVIGFILSDGWYAGRLGILGLSRPYGDRLRVRWQLQMTFADGTSSTVGSDASAVSSTDGPIRYSDLAVGERYDARIEWAGWSTVDFDDSSWSRASEVDVDQVLVPFVGQPVRRVLELPAVEVLQTPAGETVVDFGQVVAGRVRFTVRGGRGQTVRLEHSETLDQHGNYLNNIVGPNKDQTDVYTLAGQPHGETWEPMFTFHGFRYARLHGFGDSVSPEDFTAIVTASDLPVIGSFQCSDPRLNRLHQNVVWSQRGNFLSIPTDCPQRERYGWTGDLQIFAPTAATNMSVGPFLQRWLAIVRADQMPDGRIKNISPTPPPLAFIDDQPTPSYDDPIMLLTSSAGWGDVIAVAPWVLYEHYADRRVLADNYQAMKAWTEYQIRSAENGIPARLRDVSLTAEQRERNRYLWNSEPHFGDWLAPSTLAGLDGDQINAPRRTGEVVGVLFHGHLLSLLARIAEVLAKHDDAERYAARSRAVWEAFAAEYIDEDGRIPGDLQGPYVLALAFGAVPEHLRRRVVDNLVSLIHEAGDHLDTGFLSVPFLLDVLWDNDERDLARTLLFQDTAPSWLYEVDRGATTIWEGWEAIRPDGEVTELSFNHYAFGCVDDWLYRRIAGLQSVEPGYRHVRIEPDVECGLASANAHIVTPYGRLAAAWELEDGCFSLRVEVPANASATIVLPRGARPLRIDDRPPHDGAARQLEVGSGVTTVTFTLENAGAPVGAMSTAGPR